MISGKWQREKSQINVKERLRQKDSYIYLKRYTLTCTHNMTVYLYIQHIYFIIVINKIKWSHILPVL